MKFFFDRCVPHRLARMIDAYDASHDIRHHDDLPKFNPATADIEWMQALASNDPPWVVVSGDGRILRNHAERVVLRQSNLAFFHLTKQWMHMSMHEKAWKFLKVWDSITSYANVATPQVFQVGAGSAMKVELLGPTSSI